MTSHLEATTSRRPRLRNGLIAAVAPALRHLRVHVWKHDKRPVLGVFGFEKRCGFLPAMHPRAAVPCDSQALREYRVTRRAPCAPLSHSPEWRGRRLRAARPAARWRAIGALDPPSASLTRPLAEGCQFWFRGFAVFFAGSSPRGQRHARPQGRRAISVQLARQRGVSHGHSRTAHSAGQAA